MRIGELAKRVGLSSDTIRFYEKQGLLGETVNNRSENNYRNYAEAAIERLNLIARAKRLGFSLSEILELGRLWNTGRLNPEARVWALQEKLDQLRHKKLEIEQLEAVVQEKLAVLRQEFRDSTGSARRENVGTSTIGE